MRLLRPPTVIVSAVVTVAVVVAAAVVFTRDDPAPAVSAREATPPGRATARLGVFRTTDAAAVRRFEAWLGRPVDDVVDFSARSTWAEIADPEYLLREWQGTGHRLVLAVPMLPEDEPADLGTGARGGYDGHFRDLAARLVRTGHPDAVLRIGWEFNLDTWPWSTPDSATFRAYFRRIVAAMRSVPGQRFTVDWNVNNGASPYDATGYWPGDDVVDVVGVDAYDTSGSAYPYPARCDAGCRARHQSGAWEDDILGGERGLRFWASFAREHGKRLSLPEWGLWQRPDGTGGGDDPAFVRRMYEFVVANDVAYQAYFEFDGDDGEHSLSRAFPKAGAEYRRLFAPAPTS